MAASRRAGKTIVALLTDFGTADPYVAAMKGVLLSRNPSLTLVDISHQVPPQDVHTGAFLLGQSAPFFPPGTIFLAVVDPGVGTERRGLLLVTPRGLFVGPDNGIFTYILREALGQKAVAGEGFLTPFPVLLAPPLRAYSLTNPRHWRHPVSPTFHGRDIFAPVAGHLALGVPPDEVGEPVDRVTALSIPVPERRGEALEGRVLLADRFGNLITTIPGDALPEERVEVEVAGHRVPGLAKSYGYGEPGKPLALIGSHGFLEVAVPLGSAREALGAGVGTPVRVRPA